MEDELSYFIKYNDIKIIDLSKEQATIDNNTKLNMETKLKDNKNLILLYNDSSLLKNYEDLIKKYNIKTIGIKVYNGEDSYEDVLKYNLENLEGFYEKEVNKK
ncbi:hypothetical protein [Clostridium sp. OS1-26]|uniref:hypothetical protein n=1 Tax=Clostridium sp. OS1-26 TaxID=3070681 RepID=UPI0027DF2B3B|nr:hypothetical protein [Clostridium sp. OS1-26]WML36116.1 hypothetical protein RCG18_05185 [Clostridium sp. OS1-26]